MELAIYFKREGEMANSKPAVAGMTKRNEFFLILLILISSFVISKFVSADQRIYKPEIYYGQRDRATEFLQKLHPVGSDVALAEYTLRRSDFIFGGRVLDSEEAKRQSMKFVSDKTCCILWYTKEFFAIT